MLLSSTSFSFFASRDPIRRHQPATRAIVALDALYFEIGREIKSRKCHVQAHLKRYKWRPRDAPELHAHRYPRRAPSGGGSPSPPRFLDEIDYATGCPAYAEQQLGAA
ncbi:hypothetical protein VTO73DRAFT_6175 [Trametes versicolor]